MGLGRGSDEASHEAVHASIGAARSSYWVEEVVSSWRRATKAAGGRIGDGKIGQIVQLELLFARIRRRLALVLGQSRMAGVGASPRWSRLAQPSPEGGDRRCYSSKKGGVGVREREDKRKNEIFV